MRGVWGGGSPLFPLPSFHPPGYYPRLPPSIFPVTTLVPPPFPSAPPSTQTPRRREQAQTQNLFPVWKTGGRAGREGYYFHFSNFHPKLKPPFLATKIQTKTKLFFGVSFLFSLFFEEANPNLKLDSRTSSLPPKRKNKFIFLSIVLFYLFI